MDKIQEKERLKNLLGVRFMDKSGDIWVVNSVSHNIYKDVVLDIVNSTKGDGHHRELIEDSEDYHKKYKRID